MNVVTVERSRSSSFGGIVIDAGARVGVQFVYFIEVYLIKLTWLKKTNNEIRSNNVRYFSTKRVKYS